MSHTFTSKRLSGLLSGCILGALACASTASVCRAAEESALQDSVASFDITSWTMPAGFKVYPHESVNIVFLRADPTNWLLIGIYPGRTSSGDLAAGFTQDWKDVTRASQTPAPVSIARKVGAGIDAREGGMFEPSVGYIDLINVEAGDKIVSILIETGNPEGMTTYRATIDTLLASLVVRRGGQVAPPAATATPAPPVQRKKQITLEDLAGVWDEGSATGVTYELLAGGAYAGAWTHFFATEYTLDVNGDWKSRFWQTRPPWRTSDSGTWGIEEGLFVLHRGVDEKYRILRFETAADGATTMELILPDVVPTEYTSGRLWARRAPKK